MPPKTRFTKDAVVNAAFKIVRKNGMEALSAQSIARELKSSIAPIYTQTKSMNKLKEEVVHKIFRLFVNYQTKTWTEETYLNLGLGYVFFALKEKHFFSCINDKRYKKTYQKYAADFYKHQLEKLNSSPVFSALPKKQRHRIMMKGIILSHGIAALIVNSNLDYFNKMKNDKKEVRNLLVSLLSEELKNVKQFIKLN
jgi:DNA-binding transcriptional regulator YbjK